MYHRSHKLSFFCISWSNSVVIILPRFLSAKVGWGLVPDPWGAKLPGFSSWSVPTSQAARWVFQKSRAGFLKQTGTTGTVLCTTGKYGLYCWPWEGNQEMKMFTQGEFFEYFILASTSSLFSFHCQGHHLTLFGIFVYHFVFESVDYRARKVSFARLPAWVIRRKVREHW